MEKIYKDKNVVVTGHTGFKGSWLVAWLKQMGAAVTGIALDPPSIPNHFEASGLAEGINDHRIDIRDGSALEDVIREAKPDFCFIWRRSRLLVRVTMTLLTRGALT